MSKTIPWLENVTEDQVACVVAHPDDEVFLSAVLARSPRSLMVHVTDGGTCRSSEWQGHPTRESYAASRARELDMALYAVGHQGQRVSMGFVDGTVVHELLDIVQWLRDLFSAHRTAVCFTHAYEGGHPDHDGIAFAVSTAAHSMPWEVTVVESPFYRVVESGGDEHSLMWQSFATVAEVEGFTVELSLDERERKRRMCEAHKSQSGIFPWISHDREFFRKAPAYDFSQPPNRGQISRYWSWAQLDEEKWRSTIRAVQAHL